MFSKDVDIDYNIILKNKVPLLINDQAWKRLFLESNDRSLQNIRKELEDLVQELKEKEKELNRLKIEKKKTMAKILNISDMVNNNNYNAVNQLEECQNKIYKLNEEIEDLTFRNEILPKEIRDVNYRLLKETIKLAYKDLSLDGKRLGATNEEIETLREQLRGLLEKKHDYEERINNTYGFLHGILGGKEMEKLDKDML